MCCGGVIISINSSSSSSSSCSSGVCGSNTVSKGGCWIMVCWYY